MKVAFSRIDVESVVRLVEDGSDHECARAGMTGVVIAKHASVADGKYFIRLDCGHGSGCTCAVTRDQIEPVGVSKVWN